ncbi:MAG TPA: 3-phosphoshikimate 1-carboxyvinyltransferase [Egibacteraceae bacterium]|nr:3-phosphoshikimate 1-carboxyvinyltransferase [Egibacteraceae bacterium]
MTTNLPNAPLEITPSGPIHGRLAAPASKSVTNRVLVLAALADGDSVLRRPLRSDDSDAMRAAVSAFGAPVRDEPDDGWRVTGTAGRLRTPSQPIDARLSGTTMRFAAALATLANDGATVTGLPPLLRRPIGPLVDALSQLGAQLTAPDGFPPVTAAGGGLTGGAATVQAGKSSQFASAVMMVSPYARSDVTLTVIDPGAIAYIELTADVMQRWGAAVEQTGASTWVIGAGQGYRAGNIEVEYDASAAAHLLALAAATGGSVTVTNAAPDTLQPDARVPELLQRMGAAVLRDGEAITVTGPSVLKPIEADLGDTPDQVTTLAALAALADGTSVLRGVAVARGHETDRLAALATELGKLGVQVDELPDGLVIAGGGRLRPARLATHDDHRLAMAFAAIAAAVPGIVIEQPDCVAKTYPAFWSDLAALGVPFAVAEAN